MKSDSKGQMISVRLEADELAMLDAVARQRGMTLERLAHAWLRAGLEISGLTPAADGASMPAASRPNELEDRISELRGLVQEHDERLRALEHQLGNGTSRVEAPTTRTRRRRNGRSGLHDEITAVLREAGRPMGASEIAEAIRRRGRYEAPRSGNPVSGQMVSSRVSNPQYRDLFRRKDRKISLSK